MNKTFILKAALLAAMIAPAGCLADAPTTRVSMLAPRLHDAIELPGPNACRYSAVKAAVLAGQLAPETPQLIARLGCDQRQAEQHLVSLELEGSIRHIAGKGWLINNQEKNHGR